MNSYDSFLLTDVPVGMYTAIVDATAIRTTPDGKENLLLTLQLLDPGYEGHTVVKCFFFDASEKAREHLVSQLRTVGLAVASRAELHEKHETLRGLRVAIEVGEQGLYLKRSLPAVPTPKRDDSW